MYILKCWNKWYLWCHSGTKRLIWDLWEFTLDRLCSYTTDLSRTAIYNLELFRAIHVLRSQVVYSFLYCNFIRLIKYLPTILSIEGLSHLVHFGCRDIKHSHRQNELTHAGKSLIMIRKRVGPRTVPCRILLGHKWRSNHQGPLVVACW